MDKTLLLALHDWANPWLDVFFWWISDQMTFTLPLLIVMLGLSLVIYKVDGLKAWCLLLILIAMTDTMGRGIKALAQQARPCQNMYQELHYPAGKAIAPCGSERNGMPSNHALNFFAAAFALFLTLRRKSWGFFFLSMAFLVGISRVYLGKHYPSQVLVGGLLGLALGWIYAWLCLRYFSFLRRMGGK